MSTLSLIEPLPLERVMMIDLHTSGIYYCIHNLLHFTLMEFLRFLFLV